MRRLLAALLAVVLVCSMSFPAFAAEENKEQDVTVKYIVTAAGEYRAEIQNGQATAADVIVTGAPAGAETLVVIPMTGDALRWIDSCVDGEAKAAYDIHFEDTEGNRIGANGVSVSVAASGSELTVSSVNTSGADKNLSATVSNGSVSFTTDGNNYYVVWEKKTGGETPVTPNTPNSPQTGDNSMIWLWVTIAVVSAGMIFFLVFWKRRKREEQN